MVVSGSGRLGLSREKEAAGVCGGRWELWKLNGVSALSYQRCGRKGIGFVVRPIHRLDVISTWPDVRIWEVGDPRKREVATLLIEWHSTHKRNCRFPAT